MFLSRKWLAAARVMAVATLAAPGCAARAAEQAIDAPDSVWEITRERPRGTDFIGEAAVVRLNKAAFDALLLRAQTSKGSGGAAEVIVALPMPDGTFSRFRIVESSVLAPELAAAFPQIRTYAGQGVDDPVATTRFGWTERGFHAIVIDASGAAYIDPYQPGDLERYISYRKAK
jgi:hypothetical protein